MLDNVVRSFDEDSPFADAGATTTTHRSAPVPIFSFDKFRQHFNAVPERKWEVEVLKKLLRFAQMPEGWDSYKAPPMKWDVGLFALEVLNRVMRPRTPLPQVVPSSAGGVQLEWHEKDIDLEVHIAAPYECELWFEDHRGENSPVSVELSNDFSLLQRPIALLSSR